MTRLPATASTLLGVLGSFLLSFCPTAPAFADIPAAAKALQQGRADDAVRLFQSVLAEQPSNVQAHQLLCRVYYSEEMAEPAIRECERAIALLPDDSNNQMWMGRAYGLKAENAGPFTGLTLAKKVRIAFERAAQLNAANVPAMTALGQFYIAAPALVGGGLDKAERLARQLQQTSPPAAHRLLAMIAEKHKDASLAESEFKQAVTLAKTPQAWVDLGAFYQRQSQPDQAVAALRSALEVDRAHGPALMDVASVLTDANRSSDLAEKALRTYLTSSEKSEDAPAFKVHYQLGQLLARRGDSAGARREYTAALALASAYSPALKAIGKV